MLSLRSSIPVAGALCALAVATALAHQLNFPKEDRLELRSGRLALHVRYDLDEVDEIRALRERFDRNSDRTLDQDEAQQLAAFLVREARRDQVLLVNGEAVTAAVISVSDRGLTGPVAARGTCGVYAILEAPLPDGPVEIRFADRTEHGLGRIPCSVTVRGYVADGDVGGASKRLGDGSGFVVEGLALASGGSWSGRFVPDAGARTLRGSESR